MYVCDHAMQLLRSGLCGVKQIKQANRNRQCNVHPEMENLPTEKTTADNRTWQEEISKREIVPPTKKMLLASKGCPIVVLQSTRNKAPSCKT